MNDIKSILDEIENNTRLVCNLRIAGYGKEIDAAYAALESEKITEPQYWAYIKGLAGQVVEVEAE